MQIFGLIVFIVLAFMLAHFAIENNKEQKNM